MRSRLSRLGNLHALELPAGFSSKTRALQSLFWQDPHLHKNSRASEAEEAENNDANTSNNNSMFALKRLKAPTRAAGYYSHFNQKQFGQLAYPASLSSAAFATKEPKKTATATSTTSTQTKKSATSNAKVASNKAPAPKKPFMATLKKADLKLLEKYPDPRKPKHPVSGYMYFTQEIHKKRSDLQLGEAGPLWKALDEAEKEKYNAQGRKSSRKYAKEMEFYKENEEKSVKKWYKTLSKIMSEKPPRTGYLGFTKENKHVFFKEGKPASESAKDVGAQWRSLGEEKRREYNEKYSQMYQTWKQNLDQLYS